MMACQLTATTPAPSVCQANSRKNATNAIVGKRMASQAAGTIRSNGKRSVNRPRRTTATFLRGSRCTQLAVKIWGRSQPVLDRIATSPIRSSLSVKWLTYSGRMVRAAMKLDPNQKKVPSRTLTTALCR